MAVDKVLLRIEAKLDALLEAQDIDPKEVHDSAVQARQERKLTPAEQQAIDNAPKPLPSVPSAGVGQVDPATNAPVVPAATTPPVTPTPNDLAELGLTADQQEELRAAGYGDRAALNAATDDDLIAIPTIGKATVTNLRAKLK